MTPEFVAAEFGSRAALTREGVGAFYRTLCDRRQSQAAEALARWEAVFRQATGCDLAAAATKLDKLARRYGVDDLLPPSPALLFALHTWYALVVRVVTDAALGRALRDPDDVTPLDWIWQTRLRPIDAILSALTARTADAVAVADRKSVRYGGDLFKPLYEELFPQSLRHALGEYYTPDWLAEHVLDQVGYHGQPDVRVLDPACGSGTFLLAAVRRLRAKACEDGRTPDAVLRDILQNICGMDLNPLAAITARANLIIAMADLLRAAGYSERGEESLPDAGHARFCAALRMTGSQREATVLTAALAPGIYACDSILADATADIGRFDFVVGNPPWIAWDNLPAQYRDATKPLWEAYGLFSLSGTAARHGGGKKDLSMLMAYRSADRYLKDGGRLGMVITQTLFQTKGAGDGFRRFRLGDAGPPLGVLRVDDLVAMRPFGRASNWTATLVLEKGAATHYPVPYVKWTVGEAGHFVQTACQAQPIDAARPGSPWLVMPADSAHNIAAQVGPSDYTAYLGANSGGANSVYWLELLAAAGDGVRVRNMAAHGKRGDGEAIETVLEPDLLYPLLRWKDIDRWHARPSAYLLLAQDAVTRQGLELEAMRQHYPRTLAYLERFRALLESRAAYLRYQGPSRPFYSMYNVGPYTLAPSKVVWRRMDRRLRAAVVGCVDDTTLGRRPMIPQETCVLVPCAGEDEAHYLCALMNSERSGRLVSAHSVSGGKGFGTPSILEYLGLRRYCANDARHVRLASLSREAHHLAELSFTHACRGDAAIGALEAEIDRLGEEVADTSPVEGGPC
jgi:hypothetical protein